jgi:hypothetical protein
MNLQHFRLVSSAKWEYRSQAAVAQGESRG